MASLEAQTFGDFEVLAVDDGSGDATRELLDNWMRRDERVRVLDPAYASANDFPDDVRPDSRRAVLEDDLRPDSEAAGDPGGGLVPALNTAAGAARAPLLARMDADDIAHSTRLERQVEFLGARPELAACGTGIEYFPADAVRSGYRRYAAWLNATREPDELCRDLFVECPIAHPALVIRASVLSGLGAYRDSGWPEDYDLVLRLHLAGMRAANLPDVLLRWRISDGRLSSAAPPYSPAAFRRCKVHFLRHGVLPRGRPVVVWGAGRVGKAFARELIRQGVHIVALVDLDPRKVGQRIHGAAVIAPPELWERRWAGAAGDAVDAAPGSGTDARMGGAAARTGGADLTRPYVLAAVGSPGAREEIRAELTAHGWLEPEDYRTVA